jgi:hypothetical protein
MQLTATDIDSAIAELKIALPICALQNIIAEREKWHRPRGELRRRLEMLRAIQLAEEARN